MKLVTLLHPFSALPQQSLTGGGPHRPFGENQLSPGSIGILPLPTGHPTKLHLGRVRASSRLSSGFTLPMGRSPGFGSPALSKIALFTLGFPMPPPNWLRQRKYEDSPAHSSIGTILGGTRRYPPLSVCTQTISGSISLGVPPIFSPFPHGTCSLSVTSHI